jgi:hypothetical protein
MENGMTQALIDPSASPEDEDAPEIAADDSGASALAERLGKLKDTQDREYIARNEDGD